MDPIRPLLTRIPSNSSERSIGGTMEPFPSGGANGWESTRRPRLLVFTEIFFGGEKLHESYEIFCEHFACYKLETSILNMNMVLES